MTGRRNRDGEAGYALTELLVAMSVGLIILMAAFLLLDQASSVSNGLSDRQDAVQRGRLAMEKLTRQVRTQVCLGNNIEPITYGDPNRLTFYADMSDGSKNVERRTIIFDPTARNVTEYVYPGIGDYPDLTFPGVPSESQVLLTKSVRAQVSGVNVPFFRYYAYDSAGGPGALRELGTPLNATDAPLVVMVKIGFTTLPERFVPRDRDATTFYNDVYVRLADPTRPTQGPRCL